MHTAWGGYGETSWHIIFLIKCVNNDDNIVLLIGNSLMVTLNIGQLVHDIGSFQAKF